MTPNLQEEGEESTSKAKTHGGFDETSGSTGAGLRSRR